MNWALPLLLAKTPPAVQKELANALAAAAATPNVKAALLAAEFDPLVLSPEQINDRLKLELDRWGQVVKATGYKAED
jgi:tripartite-type tricarboxylate transporter receptor subunit TctC